MGDFYLALYVAQIQLQVVAELMLMAMGYRKRPVIYGSVLFAQDEWIKSED